MIEPGQRLTLAWRGEEPASLTAPGGTFAEVLAIRLTAVDVRLMQAPAPWRIEAYGGGWRLAVREHGTARPVAWWEERAPRRTARLVVAPDREYGLRRPRGRGLEWSVSEEDAPLLRTGVAALGGYVEVEIDILAVPSRAEDLPVLATVLATVVLLKWMDGLDQRVFGSRGPSSYGEWAGGGGGGGGDGGGGG